MKISSSRIEPNTHQISRSASAAAMGMTTLQPMKTTFKMLKIAALCGAFATAAITGQAQQIWNGGDGTGTELGAATNWNGTLPNGANGNTGFFDGTPAGNLALVFSQNTLGTFGIAFSLATTPNQTGSVAINPPAGADSPNMRFNNFTNASGAGAFTFGNGGIRKLNFLMGTAPYTHYWINNSVNPVTINSDARFQMGGGNSHPFHFDGSGNWVVNNSIRADNNAGTTLIKEGSGTMTWSAGGQFNSALGSPAAINGGTLILKSSTLLGTQRITNNGTMLQYDAAVGACTLSGPIHGAGLLRVSAGALTLSSSQSDFTGNIELTGGTLTVSGTQNDGGTGPLGIGGTISFSGGTLVFSVANTYDYSPRFSAAAGQAYQLDSGGQSVVLTNNLASSDGTFTKTGSGTITLGGTSSFSGLTTVSGGKLVFQAAKTGSGNITVAGSTALGVTATGTQVTPATLTTSAGAILEFNNVTSTVTAILAAGTVSAGGSITFNVNSGSFAVGQSYPLLSWSSGSAPAVTLGTLTGAGGNLSTNGNTIQLNITSLAYIWTGITDGNWDTTTANNWTVNGVSQLWVNGNTALFDDSAAGQTNVTLNAPISPASVTVNSSAKTYSITSSGANLIGGSGSLTKSGGSILTLAGGVNAYSGATAVNGGILSVGALASGGGVSDIGAAASGAANLVLNGGALQYTGGAQSSDRLFTLGTGNGAIDASGSGALDLNNAGAVALSGSGARTLTLRGSSGDDNTLAAVLGDSGGATSLAKSGAGKWVLTGNNTYSGGSTIAGGTLQVGAGGASGALGSGNITANGTLIFNRSGTLTNGVISGSGSVTVGGGGKVVLPGNNTYTGGTTISSGSTLQVGVGGATGSLSSGNGIINDGTLIFDTTGSFSYLGNGLISGLGNVIMRGSGGLVKIIGANSYTGWTLIEPGATLQPTEGNSGALASSVVTNNGTLKFVNQVDSTFTYGGPIVGTGMVLKEGNNSLGYDLPLTGTNTYTGGTFIAHGGIVLGDGGTPGAGSIVGNVVFTNSAVAETARSLTFNRPDDFTFPGLITFDPNLPFGNRGIVRQNGSGTLTLTANNDYPGGTVVNSGILQAGNGGTTGTIGSGPVTVNSLLVFNRSDDITFGNTFTGSGSVVKAGAGKLTLTSTNNITGSLIVSNGTLIVNSEDFSSLVNVINGTLGGTGAFYGMVILEAGTTLAPGTSVGTLTFNGNLDIGGNVAVEVDKSLSPSNDVVVVLGTLTKVGTGTLTVANLGSTLAVGDKFTLFSQPVANGAALTVTGGGATWINNLEVDGSITVSTVTAPPTLNFTTTGNSLQFTWTGSFKLQAQTNSLSVGISNNWGDYPGGGTSGVTVPVNVANGSVFFRLAPTP
jgi:fibronectin-binding autotransporter adhesin